MSVFAARNKLRDAKKLLRDDASDEAVNRAIDALVDAQRLLVTELEARGAQRLERHREKVMTDGADMTDVLGRHRSPATLPGFHKGRAPRNKGLRYPPTPPTVEEVFRILAHCDESPAGMRLKALILILWRAGLRISEALALIEDDVNPEAGSVFVRKGKNGKPRHVGIDDWVWPELQPWLEYRRTLPIGPLFCVLQGATAGRAWSTSAVRRRLPQLAAEAGVRKRCAPHQLRHGCAVQMREEGFDVVYISRHLGHSDLAITTHYMRGISDDEIIAQVRQRPVPQISGLAAMNHARPALRALPAPTRELTHA